MTDPPVTFQFLPVPAAAALIVTALIAYLLGRRLEPWPAVIIAGLAVPIALLGMGIYHAATTPAAAHRRFLLIAGLGVAATVSPVTLIVSRLAVGYARS